MKFANKVYFADTVGAALELKEQAAKSSNTSSFKRNLTAMGSSAQLRIFSGAGGATKAVESSEEKIKAAEESLRMVVYLSCWGPN